jgi:mRNA-degrading endonuclease RelE of RelBE toxin-antitoxin system
LYHRVEYTIIKLANYYLERGYEMDYLKVFEFPVSDKMRKLAMEPVNIDLIKKNKYANNSSYVPESVYKRILNKISDSKWSFIPHDIQERGEGKSAYVEYIGLLIVPGFGVHTGIGTQALNKKDNANATAAAKTYAFKNACKEMGLAPNIGDEEFDEELFENIDEEEMDFTEEAPEEKPKKKSKPKGNKKKSKADKDMSQGDRIKEVRLAYELDSDDDFVAFIQIWDESILELDDMDDDDWDEFLDFLEENKEEFEDF